MRRLVSGLLGLLSVLLLPLALVGLWGSTTLTRTDVFVDEVRPLIATRPVQDALTEAVVQGVLAQLQLMPSLEKVVEPPLRAGAVQVIASPQMASVWATSMAALQRQFVAVMEGRPPTGVDKQGRVVIAVPITVPGLAATLASIGVVVAPTMAPVAIIPVGTVEELQWARVGYSLLSTVGPWGPLVVVGLAVLAVLLALRRRGAALLIVAGWAIVSVAFGLALVAARQPLVDQVVDPTVRALANAADGLAQRGIFTELAVVLGVCAVLFLVLGLARGRRPA